jgi:DHA1 family bicyclomycin/chloramphenicol resistance-like MFS transporter
LTPTQAQKVMSQITIFFGVAPAVAPIMGGWLFVHLGWHSVFWFLTAIGVALWVANYRFLPETLHQTHRQPLNVQQSDAGLLEAGA